MTSAAHFQSKQRTAAKMSRIGYSVQTLTAGGPGSTLSLCFCVEKFHFYSQERKILARYLFNAGDNLPRVAQENKIKLRDVRFLGVSSLFPHNTGGLPALVLALSDLGVARLHVAGPPGLHGCLHHAAPFTNRRFPEVAAVEVSHDVDAEIYEDEYVVIRQMPVTVARPDGSLTAVGLHFICQPKFADRSVAVFAVPVYFDPHEGVALLNSIVEQQRCSISYFAPLDDSTIPDARIAELEHAVHGCLRVFPSGAGAAGPPYVLQQRMLDMCVRNMISPKHFLSPKTPLPDNGSTELPEAWREGVTNDGVEAIRAALEMEREERFAEISSTTELTGSRHAAPLEQLALVPEETVPQDAEAVAEESGSPSAASKRQRRTAPSVTLRTCKRCTQESMLLRLAPLRLLVRALVQKHDAAERATSTAGCMARPQPAENRDAAARLKARILGVTAPGPPFRPPPPSTPPPPPPQATFAAPIRPPPPPTPPPPSSRPTKLHVPAGDIRVIFLGTGSAAPSKHRNSTAILLLFKDQERKLHSVVLDAGDGLFGQLAACFDDEDLRELLLSIRLVWVSHKHADHQCGLPRLLAEIRRLHGASISETSKVTVVAPQEVISYTFFVGCLSGHDDLIDCRTCSDMNESNNSSLRRLCGQTAGALRSVYSTRVEHCHDAYAVKLVLLGKIIVYSGDCRPNSKLPTIGEHCDLLVHEATFDDQLAADAVKKRHCTVSEAVDIAEQMRARCCVLTHFSQRYPVIPATPAHHGSDSTCCVLSAWDYFTFCLASDQHSASHASSRAAAILAEVSQLLSADEL